MDDLGFCRLFSISVDPLRSIHLASGCFFKYHAGGFLLSSFNSPAVDVTETEDEYIFEIELPGFTKEEIEVTATVEELSTAAQELNTQAENSSNIIGKFSLD